MLERIIKKTRGLLFKPAEEFQQSRTDETLPVITYFFSLLIFCAGITTAIQFLLIAPVFLLSASSSSGGGMSSSSFFSPEMLFSWVVTGFLAIIILVTFFAVLFALWTHVWVYLLGGRNGFFQTLHAILYSMTPSLLFGWIPLFGFFANIWTLILFFFGIRELQDMDDGRAVAVILLSVFVTILVLVILFMAVTFSYWAPGLQQFG